MKVTVPVAALGVTVAVNVTEDPYVEGLLDEETVVELDTWFTVWVKPDDVLPANVLSPPYTAVME
jgi:hypothetical protein